MTLFQMTLASLISRNYKVLEKCWLVWHNSQVLQVSDHTNQLKTID